MHSIKYNCSVLSQEHVSDENIDKLLELAYKVREDIIKVFLEAEPLRGGGGSTFEGGGGYPSPKKNENFSIKGKNYKNARLH